MNITHNRLKIKMFSSTLKIQNESNWPTWLLAPLTTWPQPGLVLLCPGDHPALLGA